jgi:hypothetical protein
VLDEEGGHEAEMRSFFAAAMVPILLVPPAAAAGERVVLVIENRSSRPDAAARMASSVELSLQRKGYEVVSGAEVADFLEAVGSPHVDGMPARTVDKLLLRFHAGRALAVTVSFFLEAEPRDRGPGAKPAVGLSAKLLDASGAQLWHNSIGAIGEDSGFGLSAADAVRRMGASVCERLFWSFPKAGRNPRSVATTAAPIEGPPRFPLLIRPRTSIP